MNKDVEIRCRVSEEEKTLIKHKAKQAGMKMSEYIRYVSLGDVEIKISTEIKER